MTYSSSYFLDVSVHHLRTLSRYDESHSSLPSSYTRFAGSCSRVRGKTNFKRREKVPSYQVHIMRIAEPAVVCETSLATKLAVMSKSTVDIAASLPRRARDGARFMLQYENLTRAETLAVMIVTVLGGGTVAGEMIAVTALARLLSPAKEALLRARIRTW